MHVNAQILYAKLVEFIHRRYEGADKELLLSLTQVVLFNNPSQNCVIKGAICGIKFYGRYVDDFVLVHLWRYQKT